MSKELRAEFKTALLKKRPKLSVSSQTTYASLLMSLSKNTKSETVEGVLKSEKENLKYIEGLKSVSAQKTLLSALWILTENEAYQKVMVEHIKTTNDKYRNSTVSENRKNSYLSPAQLTARFNKSKEDLKVSPSVQHYVDYLICALMTGQYTPPRRLEWSQVKWKNYDVKTDNFLDIKKSTVVFNQYKTVNKFGQQTVKVDSEVMKVIKKWIKINDSDYLLTSASQKQLSASALSGRIGAIFGDKTIGIDVIRSIYISDIYSRPLPSQFELEKIATQMSHSVASQMAFYRKVDIKAK